jgi:hypothetical protein
LVEKACIVSRNNLAWTSSVSLQVRARSKARLAVVVCRITSSAYRVHAVVISCAYWRPPRLVAEPRSSRFGRRFPALLPRNLAAMAVGRLIALFRLLRAALPSMLPCQPPFWLLRLINVAAAGGLGALNVFFCKTRQDLRRCKNGVSRP